MEMYRCPWKALPPTTVHTAKRSCRLAITGPTLGHLATPVIVTLATFILTLILEDLIGIGAAGGMAVTSGNAGSIRAGRP